MEKRVKDVRNSFLKDARLDTSVVKPGQAVLLNYFTKHNAALFYRQAGKSFFNWKVQDAVIFDPSVPDPSTLIMCPTKDQTEAIYGPYFTKYYGKLKTEEGKVMTYQDRKSSYAFNRSLIGKSDWGYAEIGGCGSGEDRPAQAKRGRTKDIMVLDEYGDWPEKYFTRVISAHGDIRDAPHLKTGTAKPGTFEDDFLFYESKMLGGDKDYFALKWDILTALKYGEVTQKFVDKKYEFYVKTKDMAGWESEYMLNFKAYLKDRAFGREINELFTRKRVGDVPRPPQGVVDTFWDLGVNGTTCWIRYDTTRGDVFYLKYLEQLTDAHFATFVKQKLLPYLMSNQLRVRYNIFPSDGGQREFMSLNTRLQEANRILPGTTKKIPVIRNVDDAIDFTKGFLRRCYFDRQGCSEGIRHLELYEFKGKGVPKDRKVKHHHCADAFIVSALFNGDGLNPGHAFDVNSRDSTRGELYFEDDLDAMEDEFLDLDIRSEREWLTSKKRKSKEIRNWGY